MEESFIVFNWSEHISKNFEKKDFNILKNWLELYVSNWAACDTFCNHTIVNFIEMYPEYISEIKKWAESDNRWVKRAATVTLILPARKGLFLNDCFEIFLKLIEDKDDLVQKGFGWLLKEASKAHQKEVFDFVMKHKKIMPRTSLRYAIVKMPHDLKQKAMKR